MPDAELEIAARVEREGRAVTAIISRKVSTARRVYHSGGALGILAVVREKAALATFGFVHRLRTSFWTWCQKEHWWVELIVALRGNVVRLDSCTFDVSDPVITRATKSLFLFNRYERPERDILKAYLDRGRPVIELGGSVGVVACVTNRLLTDRRRHVVVEGNPDLIPLLTANRDRNGCLFTILNRALAYGGDETTFYKNAALYLASSVQVETAVPIRVPTISLGHIIQKYGLDGCTLVCDIEGGEFEMVRYESDVLRDHVETIIVEVHGWRVGQDEADAMIRTLEQVGFRCLHEREATYVFRNEKLAPRPDEVAGP